MTQPDNSVGLQSVGLFESDQKDAFNFRQKLAATAMEWFQKCQNERTRQERQWYLNLAFYMGNQHVQFKQAGADGAFDLYVPKAPYYRVRMVINQTRKIIRKEIARLTAQKPNAYVVPASAEDSDVFAAQAGEQIWDSLWRRLEFNKTLRQAVAWKAVCGNGFIKTWWDKNKVDPDNPTVYGDICIESIPPFYIFVPDLLQEDLEKQPYIIHAQVRTKSWIAQNFGIQVSDDAKLDAVDDVMQNVLGVNRNNSKKENSVILEIWVKPGVLPDLPKGAMFTVAANQVVQGFDQWPYDSDKYPFAKIDGIWTGKFYNESSIVDLIPIQRELNRTRSQLIEAKNRTAKPQLMGQRGSVNPRKITTEPGQFIEVEVGYEFPQPLPIQNLPNYVTEEINRLYDDMADLSGQHDVSNGSTPPGVTAATAISFLQEQDESLTAPEFTSIEEAIEKIASYSLNFVKMFWDEARTVKVTGLEGTFDAMVFKSSDIRSNTDVRVEAGSSLPTSRAAKQAFLMDLMKMGFIPPDKGLELMELGGLSRLYEEIQIDKRQAQRENLRMRVVTDEDIMMHQQTWLAENAPPSVMPGDPPIEGEESSPALDVDSGLNLEPPLLVPTHTYDNHEIHIEEHNRYRKSQAFEKASDATKRMFELHVREHIEATMGMMTHPLTGMSDSNPNAAPMGEEEDQQAQMEEEQPSSGPAPMPEMSDEMPEGGM